MKKTIKKSKIIKALGVLVLLLAIIGSINEDSNLDTSLADTTNKTQTNNPVTNSNETNDAENNNTEINDTEINDTETSDTETNNTETNNTETIDTEINDTETNDTETNDTETNDAEINNAETSNIVEIYTKNNKKFVKYENKSYQIISVDGGDLSGDRKPNVAVDVGYGDRVYWALTNQYGQLVYVIADKIVLQDDRTEPVNSDGRYYNDEAKVPGTERKDLDEGHVIADSLGGVSNAYNITPQNSTLNRHGDQAYMEKVIRDAGGCENFIAKITYPDNKTQIPSHYHYEYVLNGVNVVDDFDNIDPDKANENLNNGNTNSNKVDNTDTDKNSNKVDNANTDKNSDKVDNTNTETELDKLNKVDTNRNGKVTISEAKAAGYKMPITKDHWLYKYMIDKDGDGMVGE